MFSVVVGIARSWCLVVNKTVELFSSQTCCVMSDFNSSAYACVVRQSGTNFHRICNAQTQYNTIQYNPDISIAPPTTRPVAPGNSLCIELSAGCSNVLMAAGGASDRRWLKVRCTNGLTYLLTYCKLLKHVDMCFVCCRHCSSWDVSRWETDW